MHRIGLRTVPWVKNASPMPPFFPSPNFLKKTLLVQSLNYLLGLLVSHLENECVRLPAFQASWCKWFTWRCENTDSDLEVGVGLQVISMWATLYMGKRITDAKSPHPCGYLRLCRENQGCFWSQCRKCIQNKHIKYLPSKYSYKWMFQNFCGSL